MFEQICIEKLTHDLPEASVFGFEHLLSLPDDTPCIFMYSHKNHSEEGLGHETRQLTKLAKMLPGKRTLRHIVRPSDTILRQIGQKLSPLHVIIHTEQEEPIAHKRGLYNREVLEKLVQSAAERRGIIISIAPDAGRTSEDYPELVDSSKVSAGGTYFLYSRLREILDREIPIIPISFDHAAGQIWIGKDIGTQFTTIDKARLPQVIANSLNSLVRN